MEFSGWLLQLVFHTGVCRAARVAPLTRGILLLTCAFLRNITSLAVCTLAPRHLIHSDFVHQDEGPTALVLPLIHLFSWNWAANRVVGLVWHTMCLQTPALATRRDFWLRGRVGKRGRAQPCRAPGTGWARCSHCCPTACRCRTESRQRYPRFSYTSVSIFVFLDLHLFPSKKRQICYLYSLTFSKSFQCHSGKCATLYAGTCWEVSPCQVCSSEYRCAPEDTGDTHSFSQYMWGLRTRATNMSNRTTNYWHFARCNIK